MRIRTMALILTTFLLTASCATGGEGDGGDGDEAGRPVEGGTLIFGAEQEPTEGLNGELACCNLFWNTFIIESPVLEGAYEPQPDFTYKPNLIEDEAELTEDPFTLTYTIKDEAQWSDGTPISAQDFEFTWRTYVDLDNEVSSRAGYEQIRSADIVDDKTITFTFREPYAGYRDLFSPVLPRHALEGEDFNKVWKNAIVDPNTGDAIASGPFQFKEWEKGNQLTLVRNDNYWGEHVAYLDEIVFRFITETQSEIEAMRGGEVDAIYPQPQLELANLQNLPDLTIETKAGTAWEHADFQLAHPLLGETFVRQAIAHAVDREAMVDQLFADLAPEIEPLENLVYLSDSEFYESHFDQYSGDTDTARSLLEDNGCSEGDDGIYECNGERLSFEMESTTGNALRELVFEVVQEQLVQAGIEIKADFSDAAVFVADLGKQDFDWAMYAYFVSPDPGNAVPILSCDGDQNDQNYCNEEVTELLKQSDVTADPAERAALLNEADSMMAEDVPILPLYQKPNYFAFDNKLQGASDNPAGPGPTWNTEEWWISE